MIEAANGKAVLPASIGAAVLTIGLFLVVITARGPYTHANRDSGYDPGYARTQQTFVGSPVPFPGGRLAVLPASDPVERGKQLFVAEGCAGCHGLEGRGGIVGPPIIGTKASRLRARTSVGPGGMPAFASNALTDDDLAAIAAFLSAPSK